MNVSFLVMLLLLVAAPILSQAATGQEAKPQPITLSEALLARLPSGYRTVARELVQETNDDQQRLAAMSDEKLITAVFLDLSLSPEGAKFLTGQLEREQSPTLRSQIIGSMWRYWRSHPEEQQILEHHVTSDPNSRVSLAALAMLQSIRMDALHELLKTRTALAEANGDLAGYAKLDDEQNRWFRQQDEITLPSFLEIPPPLFSVAPPNKSIRVLAFGDFGTGSEAQRETAAAMVVYGKTHPFDFGLTLGDNFYLKGMESPNDPRWQTQWEQLYGPLGIKFYATLGNHDWYGADSPAAEILYTAKSTSWRMPSPYYTFAAGAVQFFAFDTPEMNEAELMWLDNELAKSTARWKVVYGHYHIFSASLGDNRELILRLLPILEKYHVDIYLNGHAHVLEELRSEGGVHFFTSGGGGASLHSLNPYDRSAYKQKVNGFTVLEADQNQFKVSFIGTDGKELYQDTFTK